MGFKDKWYVDGLRFRCTQCGNCCGGAPGYVWVNRQHIREIARFLSDPDEWLGREHLRRVGFRYSLTERANGDCIFLTRNGRGEAGCRIYPVRPPQCRTWPFWSANLRSRAAWEAAAKTCPGMNVGDHFDLETIERRRAASGAV